MASPGVKWVINPPLTRWAPRNWWLVKSEDVCESWEEGGAWQGVIDQGRVRCEAVPVMRCHDTSRRHPEYEDSENIPRCREDSDGGSGGEKTNQVCEHYSARKLCFKCEKLWKDGRMLRVGASQIHNGPKKEAAGCKWTLQQLELKVTMSGSGRRLVGAKSRNMQNTAGVYLGLLWIPSFWLWHCNIDLTTELRDNDRASECYQTSQLMNLFNIISFLLSAFQNNLHHTLLTSMQINI